LIVERLCFESLREAAIVYLWKRNGPEKPRRLLGKCQRPGGLLAHFAQAHFVVWLAANNCTGLTNWQIEALVFHELKHAYVGSDGKAVSVPHDWEGFAEEIQRYGLWKRDIVPIAEAVGKALALPFPEHEVVGSQIQPEKAEARPV
jgi:Putative phage metallopeptidase